MLLFLCTLAATYCYVKKFHTFVLKKKKKNSTKFTEYRMNFFSFHDQALELNIILF